MKSFVLINFAHLAYLVHVYGVIQAPDANAAAAIIGSEVVGTTTSGTIGGATRYRLKESESGRDAWFLEEVQPISARPEGLTRNAFGISCERAARLWNTIGHGTDPAPESAAQLREHMLACPDCSTKVYQLSPDRFSCYDSKHSHSTFTEALDCMLAS